MTGGVSFEAVVRARRDAAEGVVVLDLERTGGTLPHWSPGAQYPAVAYAREARRGQVEDVSNAASCQHQQAADCRTC